MPKYTVILCTTKVVEIEANDIYDCGFQAEELAEKYAMDVYNYYKNDNQPNTEQDED